MGKIEYLTENEITKMLEVVHGTEDEALLKVALETGAKPSGIQSIRFSSISMQHSGYFVVIYDAGIPGRLVLVSHDTYWLLYERAKDRGYYNWTGARESQKEKMDKRIFPRLKYRHDGRPSWVARLRNPGPISPRTLNRKVQRWADSANIKRKVHWGMLKHTCIIRLLKSGKPFEEVAQRLGLKARSLYLMYRQFLPTPQEADDLLEYHL